MPKEENKNTKDIDKKNLTKPSHTALTSQHAFFDFICFKVLIKSGGLFAWYEQPGWKGIYHHSIETVLSQCHSLWPERPALSSPAWRSEFPRWTVEPLRIMGNVDSTSDVAASEDVDAASASGKEMLIIFVIITIQNADYFYCYNKKL